MTRKRALTVFFGLLLAGWLIFSQAVHLPAGHVEDHAAAKQEQSTPHEDEQLRVKLLLLGVEFIIERTVSSD